MPSSTSISPGGLLGSNSIICDSGPGVAGSGDKSQNAVASIFAESAHPVALFFALLVSNSFVFVFALTVVLLAADFWTVKNVTGRMLIGRRWWSAAAADGSTVWSFEARPAATYKPNPSDARLFWSSLYGYTAIWALLGLLAVLRFNFSWLLVVGFGLTLNIVNLIGYTKCSQDSQAQMSNSIGSSLISGYISNKLSSFLS